MYLEYKTATTWSKKEVMIDLIKACTGTFTSVSQFSASCDKTVTNFAATTVAPGWTMVDDQSALATNPFFIISAPDAAGVTKMMKVMYVTSNNSVFCGNMTSYNSTTKVSDADTLNNSGLTTSNSSSMIIGTVMTTSAAVYRLYCSQRYIGIMSFVNGSYDNKIVSWELPRPAGSAYWASGNGKSTHVVLGVPANIQTNSTSYGVTGEFKLSTASNTNYSNAHLLPLYGPHGMYSGAQSASQSYLDFVSPGNNTGLHAILGGVSAINTFSRIVVPAWSINGFLEDSICASPHVTGLSPLDEVTANNVVYQVAGSGTAAHYILWPKV